MANGLSIGVDRFGANRLVRELPVERRNDVVSIREGDNRRVSEGGSVIEPDFEHGLHGQSSTS
jgi:hypothetical protein